MKRAVIWFFVNAIFGVSLYIGMQHKHDGFLSVGMFLLWFAIIGSIGMVFDSVKDKLVADGKGRSVPDWIGLPFDVAVTCFIVFHGYHVTGVFYMIHTVIMQNGWDEVEKRIAAKSA